MSAIPIIMLGIGVGFFLTLRSKNTSRVIVLDSVNLEMVIRFFKRPYVIQKLQQNQNLLAIAAKTGNNILTLACFDKETKEIKSEFISYRFKTMDTDLAAQFGDKDMIVLQ